MHQDVFWPPAKYLAERFGVHITTARRWVRERNAPEAVIMLLSQDLGIFDQLWRGWTLRAGKLYSPEQLSLTPGEARSYTFMQMQIASKDRDLRELRQQIAMLERDGFAEEQPQPCEWDLERLLG